MMQHASSAPEPSSAEPSLAERARTLLASEKIGTLATHSLRHAGWPFASVMPYALAADGAPTVLISAMAVHTQNLLADARASMLVMQSGSDADALGSARVTLLGTVNKTDGAVGSLRQLYLDRHPEARHWVDFSDFSFFRLDVTDVYFVGGFGVMGWVAPRDYASAQADPLVEHSAGIIEHMNRDHAEALREIARHFGGLDAEAATMVACDRLGFSIRATTAGGIKGARIAFPGEVRSREDARKMLVAMTRTSRAK